MEAPEGTTISRKAKLINSMGRLKLRPILIGFVASLVVLQIVALSPAPLEESRQTDQVLEPSSLIAEEAETLATGIPKNQIPEYSVGKFEYVSTRSGERQWQLQAETALLYNKTKLVHARRIKAFLYDSSGKITVVTGKEAKYFMNQRDLEIFGEVDITFPDGFNLLSDYMRYLPGERRIDIPVEHLVRGAGAVQDAEGQRIAFESQGLRWEMSRSGKIQLRKAVRFTFDDERGDDGPTRIQSDYCTINRASQLAHFTMDPKLPVEKRFVRISQETTNARSRRADLNYGSSSRPAKTSGLAGLQYMTLFEDVLIREEAKDSLQYATGGRADFDSNRDLILLSEFPQVYQDNDTVTGDVIILHRDSGVVEVKNSNAFSQGVQAPGVSSGAADKNR